MINALFFLAANFRNQAAEGRRLDAVSAAALHHDVFVSLMRELDKCIDIVSDWPRLPLNRLRKQTHRVQALAGFLQGFAEAAGYEQGMIGVPQKADVVSSAILKLLSKPVPHLSEREQEALEVLRQSNRKLLNAPLDVLSDYVCSMRIDRLRDLVSSIRQRHQEQISRDPDALAGQGSVLHIYDTSDHSAVHIVLIDAETGERVSMQIGAENYAKFVRRQNELSGDAELFNEDTDGVWVASGASGVGSRESGPDLGKGNDYGDAELAESMGVAGMVNLARNAGALLKGQSISQKRKLQMIEDGVVTASVVGLTQLVL